MKQAEEAGYEPYKRGPQREIMDAVGKAPHCQSTLFERFGVWRTACIRITFRCWKGKNCFCTIRHTVNGAIPKADVALPGFEILIRLCDNRKTAAGITLN